jgi:hypothetical protein
MQREDKGNSEPNFTISKATFGISQGGLTDRLCDSVEEKISSFSFTISKV